MRSSSTAAPPLSETLTDAVTAAVNGRLARLLAAGAAPRSLCERVAADAAIEAVAAHIAANPADAMDHRIQAALIESARQPSRFDPDQRGSWKVREHGDGSFEVLDFKPTGPGLMSTKVDQ